MRCFVAVDLPDGMVDEIVEIQEDLGATGGDFNMVDPGKVHVTLKFLGEVGEERVDEVERRVGRAAGPIGPFEASYRGMGVFPSEGYVKVVWIGADGEGFVPLASRLEDEMAEIGFEREDREFVPHATVARVKSGRAKRKIVELVDRKEKEVFGTAEVDEVKLKESELTHEGPIYSDLSVIQL